MAHYVAVESEVVADAADGGLVASVAQEFVAGIAVVGGVADVAADAAADGAFVAEVPVVL